MGYILPSFSLEDYASLLVNLRKAGYQNRQVSEMRLPIQGKVVYIRHDVDLHISLILEMAQVEKELGIHSTYYIPLTLHFNPLYLQNRDILSKLLTMGHEIGLHYDLETYPEAPEEAREYLDWEIFLLSKIIAAPIRTIVMHQPHKGQPDPFREIDKYIHPHDPRYQEDLLYISDSCRAWRDESLLTCFGPEAPRRLLLNVHPEAWLDGRITDRMQYLREVMLKEGVRQHREYVEETISQVWKTHPAPRLHDEREAKESKAMSDLSRVVLCPLTKADLPVLFAWINEREQVLFNAPYKPVHEGQHVAWFDAIQQRSDVVIFGIRLREADQLIGTCQLHSINTIHRNAELQIRIGEVSARGQGYGTEAVHLLLDFAFKDANLLRVYLHVFNTNAAAIRVYEKVGFAREGLLRQAAHIDGKYTDVIVMGILRDEYIHD